MNPYRQMQSMHNNITIKGVLEQIKSISKEDDCKKVSRVSKGQLKTIERNIIALRKKNRYGNN